MAEMLDELHFRKRIRRDQYREYITKYYLIRVRNKVSHPENVFLNPKLEKVFLELDLIIDTFRSEVTGNCTSHSEDGIDYLYHHYWLATYGPNPTDHEISDRLVVNLESLLRIGSQIEEKLADVVIVIKKLFPDFDFNPEGWVNWG